MSHVSFKRELLVIEGAQHSAMRKFRVAAQKLLAGKDCLFVFVSLDDDIRDLEALEVSYNLSVQEGTSIASRCFAVSQSGIFHAVKLDNAGISSSLEVGEEMCPPIEMLQCVLESLEAGEYVADEVLLPIGPIFSVSELDQR